MDQDPKQMAIVAARSRAERSPLNELTAREREISARFIALYRAEQGGKGRELVARDVFYSWKRMADSANSPKSWWLIEDTIKGFKALCAGDFDELPEQAFLYVGGIEEAIENAKKMGVEV